MKSSLYKVGDRVIIAQRKGRSNDYPFGFIDEMTTYSGKIATIQEVSRCKSDCSHKRFYNNDPFKYKIDLGNNILVWHSSMFKSKENNVMEQKTIIIDGVEYTCTPKEQPKKWRDDVDNIISGYFIDDVSEIVNITIEEENPNGYYNYNVFATEKQAKSALAMARISQIIANDSRFGGAITDEEWNDSNTGKFVIYREKNGIKTNFLFYNFYFLAFHTKAQCDLFLQENQDLIKDYLMID